MGEMSGLPKFFDIVEFSRWRAREGLSREGLG